MNYRSNTPVIYACLILATFAAVIIIFFVYHVSVEQRNEKLIFSVAKSNAIVSSFFPGKMRDRIIDEGYLKDLSSTTNRSSLSLKNLLTNGGVWTLSPRSH